MNKDEQHRKGRVDRSVFVTGFDERWTLKYLQTYIDHILKKNFNIKSEDESGSLVVGCGINYYYLHAFIELCSVEVAQKLVALSGRKSSTGAQLYLVPWKEAKQHHSIHKYGDEEAHRGTNDGNHPLPQYSHENYNSYDQWTCHQHGRGSPTAPSEVSSSPDPVSLKIYVHQDPPVLDSQELQSFLSRQLKKHNLLFDAGDEDAIVACTKTSDDTSWLVEAASVEVANRLLYLNRIKWNSTEIYLNRHPDYRGPPPEFHDYYIFLEKLERDRRNSACTPNEESPSGCQTSDEEASYPSPRKVTGSSLHPTEECRSDTASVRAKIAWANKMYAAAEEQEMTILRQASLCKVENVRLKKKLASAANVYAAMERQFTRLAQENKILVAKKKQVEADSKSSLSTISGENDALVSRIMELELSQQESHSEKARLTDENKKLLARIEELEKLQQGSVFDDSPSDTLCLSGPSRQEPSIERDEEIDRLTQQLSTTKQQLDAVHESWQEQHIQLCEKEKQLLELTEKCEETERRFQEATMALSAQVEESNRLKRRRLSEEFYFLPDEGIETHL